MVTALIMRYFIKRNKSFNQIDNDAVIQYAFHFAICIAICILLCNHSVLMKAFLLKNGSPHLNKYAFTDYMRLM